MKSLTLILSLLVLITSGCNLSNVGNGGALDVIENPSKYADQTITITHPIIENLNFNYWPELKYAILQEDEEGKPHTMMVKYEQFYCSVCEITATVKKIEVCECKSNYYYGGDNVAPVEKCENPPESLRNDYTDFSCKSGSIKDNYYLDVTKVIKIN